MNCTIEGNSSKIVVRPVRHWKRADSTWSQYVVKQLLKKKEGKCKIKTCLNFHCVLTLLRFLICNPHFLSFFGELNEMRLSIFEWINWLWCGIAPLGRVNNNGDIHYIFIRHWWNGHNCFLYPYTTPNRAVRQTTIKISSFLFSCFRRNST